MRGFNGGLSTIWGFNEHRNGVFEGKERFYTNNFVIIPFGKTEISHIYQAAPPYHGLTALGMTTGLETLQSHYSHGGKAR